jgi:hypothetical protein
MEMTTPKLSEAELAERALFEWMESIRGEEDHDFEDRRLMRDALEYDEVLSEWKRRER